ncbi:sensor histidine kinase [Clostridium kluyveri]|uniref:histidine kinase n=2 Tax=Clostridium kluyveri TaxID=1534 RepID=A5N7Q1_CLOK5|nr:HAMP domain-containing sensor histidine kinase [Clostridium kluyveri]EDK33332.1 Predicted sensor kinase [Clostridium kluyveri DSM 555]
MIEKHFILPANYSEKKIEENSSAILNADKVTKNLIPQGCNYGVYDEKDSMLYGSFTVEQAEQAWRAMKNNQNIIFGDRYYKVFHRKKDICIIQYSIKAQFESPLIRKYLANVELLGVVLFLILFIGEVVLLAVIFGKYLSREIKVLIEVSDNIKRKHLDFEPKHSDIHEIEEVINSLDDMKNALKESLEKQWNMEKLRKEQISALAHDINTPLTIIKGNAELMKENSIEADNIKYNDYILKSADEIEKYLRILIDITKSGDRLILKQGKIRTKAFFERIVDKESALASEKNLELINEMESVPEFFYGDEELLYRAIMNVVSNAIEYSPEFGKLIFKIYGCKNELEFLIEDNGHGFSKEELQFAAEQFYRGDKSRSSKNHYGMGLFITSSFIKLSGGIMKLSNSEQIGGAKVVLKVPLLPKSITTN